MKGKIVLIILLILISYSSFAQYNEIRFPLTQKEIAFNKQVKLRRQSIFDMVNGQDVPSGVKLFDTGGRLVQIRTLLVKTSCWYDAQGRMIKRGDTISDGKRSTVSIYQFEYNADGKISKVITPKADN